MSRLELFDRLQRLRSQVGESNGLGHAFDAILELANFIHASAESEAARAARLEALLAGVRATERRKTEFLVMAAHDVRSALKPLLDAAELLRAQEEGVAGKAVSLERHTRRLAIVVDSLVAVALANFGPTTLSPSLVDLRDVLARAIEGASPLLVDRKLTLSCVIQDEAVWLHADRQRLIQAFTNLLAHAAKGATPGGRIRIEAQALATDVVVRVREVGTRTKAASGVAQFVVRSCVESHGGAVESTRGGADRGTTLVVRLPRALVTDAPEPSGAG